MAAVTSATLALRENSRTEGLLRTEAELKALGLTATPLALSLRDMVNDRVRAERFGRSVNDRWNKLRSEMGARKALTEIDGRLRVGAATESASAYNSARSELLKQTNTATSLLKVWDAQLDKRTCFACSSMDGTIVGANERFPGGEPGGVHPNCRCTFQVLTYVEVGRSGFISPVG
jgi:SPP1 gp7 family putative phage head morphogenesis protein